MPHTATETQCQFYIDVLSRLKRHDIPFAVGGAFAFAAYTGIDRETKDLDLFCKREDLPHIASVLSSPHYRFDDTHPHWLAKIYCGEEFVDLIHNSGNGVARVDDAFFTHARSAQILGMEVPVCPVEEMIWIKAFVMERERFDGADVAHLLHAQADSIAWPWLLARFEGHHRVLLSHLILHGYVYPNDPHAAPLWVMETLVTRVMREERLRLSGERICRGTLVSREQYLVDVSRWGYVDGRLESGVMSEEEIAAWTRAIEQDK